MEQDVNLQPLWHEEDARRHLPMADRYVSKVIPSKFYGDRMECF